MQTTILGRTGLKVSVVSLGAGGKSKLGQTRGASFEQSAAVVKAAIDEGITLFDTAAQYGTEKIVGAGVKGRRDRVVISTKAPVHRDGTPSTGTDMADAKTLRRRLENSLADLGTDYVDLFHLHAVTTQQYGYCRDVLVPEMLKMKDEGKIRFLSLTERFLIDTKHEMLEQAFADDIWDVVMVGMNFVNQTALRSAFATARRQSVGTMCMYAVRGLLASEKTLNALVAKLIEKGEVDPAKLDPGASPLGFLTAPGVAESLTDAAYRFCRHTPGVDVVITGTGNIDHLRENIRSIQAGPLPAEVRARLIDIFGDVWSETGEP